LTLAKTPAFAHLLLQIRITTDNPPTHPAPAANTPKTYPLPAFSAPIPAHPKPLPPLFVIKH